MKFSHITTVVSVLAACLGFTHGLRIGAPSVTDDETEWEGDFDGRVLQTLKQKRAMCKGDTLELGRKLVKNQYLCLSQSMYKVRFGLNDDGMLAAWSNNEIRWSPGFSGDLLRIEPNGKLVLYKFRPSGANVTVWSSDCLGSGVRFRLHKSQSRLIEVLDGTNNTVWGVDHHGEESVCYPDSDSKTTSPVKCKGKILGSRVKLSPGEYLCDDIDGTGELRRFGLNARGQLALWQHHSIIWTPGWDKKGDYAHLQGSGKLVLYQKNVTEANGVWASRCKEEGSILRVNNGGLELVGPDDKIKWMVSPYGEVSPNCTYPIVTASSDCQTVSPAGNICQMRMIDHAKINYVVLRVRSLGDGRFKATDKLMANCGSVVFKDVKVDVNGTIDVLDQDGLGKNTSCTELIQEYEMKNTKQYTFLEEPRYPCTAFGKSLINFMVTEYFYKDD